MNRYFISLIVILLAIAGGFFYQNYFGGKSEINIVEENVQQDNQQVKEFTVTAKKNEWRFSPDTIEVNNNEKVLITVVNEDDYDHGFSIDDFGVRGKVPANSSAKFEFTANKIGDFKFYCSVACGVGEVNGVKRGHFDMVGKIVVR